MGATLPPLLRCALRQQSAADCCELATHPPPWPPAPPAPRPCRRLLQGRQQGGSYSGRLVWYRGELARGGAAAACAPQQVRDQVAFQEQDDAPATAAWPHLTVAESLRYQVGADCGGRWGGGKSERVGCPVLPARGAARGRPGGARGLGTAGP